MVVTRTSQICVFSNHGVFDALHVHFSLYISQSLLSYQQADLARQLECHLATARVVQIPKYGQIRLESRLLRALAPVIIRRSHPVAKSA